MPDSICTGYLYISYAAQSTQHCLRYNTLTQPFSPTPQNLIPQRHVLDFLAEPAPIIRLELRVLDALLAPVLMGPADMVLRELEIGQFVADALLDEDASGVLVDDGLLVLLLQVSEVHFHGVV